jgi:hypothetical protein
MSSRVVKFIIPQSVERVQEQESQISDLISVITGGQAIIQVRQGMNYRIQEQESGRGWTIGYRSRSQAGDGL